MSNSPFWPGNDAVGRPVLLPRRPERIISLVPSLTELLVDLDVGDRLVGRTRYCIHPREKLNSVADIGGTKNVNFEKIKALRPDLILAEKEENPREMVDALSPMAPVYVTEVTSISSAISMCRTVGKLVGSSDMADSLSLQIEIAMEKTQHLHLAGERVLYLIWRRPWMTVGQNTFIDDCLAHVGFQNVALEIDQTQKNSARYPELDPEQMIRLNPDRVFLSSEPFPFNQSHADEIRKLFPHARIDFVDGELFSWYGSRMLKMPDYWGTLIKVPQ